MTTKTEQAGTISQENLRQDDAGPQGRARPDDGPGGSYRCPRGGQGGRPMTLTIEWVTPRVSSDVARLYVEARVVGLEVSHYPSRKCSPFDGATEPGCQLGVFRTVGSLIFHKADRRWEVRANSDCTAVELATLISCGISVAKQYGRSPGYSHAQARLHPRRERQDRSPHRLHLDRVPTQRR